MESEIQRLQKWDVLVNTKNFKDGNFTKTPLESFTKSFYTKMEKRLVYITLNYVVLSRYRPVVGFDVYKCF